MPGTAKGLGINPNNPRQALHGAARLMASYVKKYGSYRKALIAYNAGPGAVNGPLPAETRNYIKTILGPGGGDGGGGGRTTTRTPDRTLTSPSYPNPERQDVLLNYFQHRGQPGALLALSEGLKATGRTPGTSVTVPGSQVGSPSGSGDVAQIASRANRVSRAHPSYSWGGGHGATPAKLGTPVDCSGAVSQVLGINPRVSGEFAKWGKPGRGAVTVYANGHHVLMEIRGHFFGTSGSNPGGGAGWIKRSQINPGYLRGFTARHL